MASDYHDDWGSHIGDPLKFEGELIIRDNGPGKVFVFHILNSQPTGEDGFGEFAGDQVKLQRTLKDGTIRMYKGTLDLSPKPPPPGIRKRITGSFQDVKLRLDDEGKIKVHTRSPDDWVANVPPPDPPDSSKRKRASKKSKK